ncbi:MAG: hypothetical protein J0G30_06570 [Actinomycetales bacterium]|nr:hypothetical protein [Actinomycetales bacterium]
MAADADRATAVPGLEPDAETVELRWNPDGSFERMREAAARSAHATLPPSAFEHGGEAAPFAHLPEQPVELTATVAPEPPAEDLAIWPPDAAAWGGVGTPN